MNKTKPFQIPKRLVYEAYNRIKANKGRAGVDDESLEMFDQDLRITFTSFGTECLQAVIFRRQSCV